MSDERHIVINHPGELLVMRMTSGNVDDRKPLPLMIRKLWDSLYGDKGYLSKTLAELFEQRNLYLITKVRKNMKEQLMPVFDKLLLRKRAVIEKRLRSVEKHLSN